MKSAELPALFIHLQKLSATNETKSVNCPSSRMARNGNYVSLQPAHGGLRFGFLLLARRYGYPSKLQSRLKQRTPRE